MKARWIANACSVAAAATVLAAATTAFAQESALPPLDSLTRITPEGASKQDPILTTRTPSPAVPAMAPVSVAPATPPAGEPTVNSPNHFMPKKSPFGHAAKPLREVPSAPHRTIAIPVPNVDFIEVSEPAPPTPLPPGADPVSEDAATPTEFSSPMFNAPDSGAPRKVVIRALNKVTSQSMLLKIPPGDSVLFGKLKITALMCRVSSPSSQLDYAGLLDIQEQLPANEGVKPLFRGWMYASSPSISSLEHPIYDVSMISCDITEPSAKADEKSGKSSSRKRRHSGR